MCVCSPPTPRGTSAMQATRLTLSANWMPKSMFDALMKTPVCGSPPNVMGRDGITYAMKIIRGFNRVQFTWWGKLPKQWANLAPLVRFMVSGAEPVTEILRKQRHADKKRTENDAEVSRELSP
jgi:hypothetical protein